MNRTSILGKVLVRSICLPVVCAVLVSCAAFRSKPQASFRVIDRGDLQSLAAQIQENPQWVQMANSSGVRPLSYAAMVGKAEACKLLLKAGASLEEKDLEQRTPIHMAASNGHSRVVSLLVGRGANLQHRDKRGLTPLHAAVSSGDLETVKLMVKLGAELNSLNSETSSVLDFAIKEMKGWQAKLRDVQAGRPGEHSEQYLEKRLQAAKAIARRLRRHGAKTALEILP